MILWHVLIPILKLGPLLLYLNRKITLGRNCSEKGSKKGRGGIIRENQQERKEIYLEEGKYKPDIVIYICTYCKERRETERSCF